MRPRVVVDANVLIAARLSRDQDHARGRRIAEAFDRGTLPVAYVPSEVLHEIVNYLQARSSHGVAEETLDATVESSGFEIQYTPKRDFDAARSLFRAHDTLSLTDAAIVASMRRQDIEYLYSFDAGFDALDGITRLTTAVDPFDSQ
jgi:predicted nucleic acid-binding protein